MLIDGSPDDGRPRRGRHSRPANRPASLLGRRGLAFCTGMEQSRCPPMVYSPERITAIEHLARRCGGRSSESKHPGGLGRRSLDARRGNGRSWTGRPCRFLPVDRWIPINLRPECLTPLPTDRTCNPLATVADPDPERRRGGGSGRRPRRSWRELKGRCRRSTQRPTDRAPGVEVVGGVRFMARQRRSPRTSGSGTRLSHRGQGVRNVLDGRPRGQPLCV